MISCSIGRSVSWLVSYSVGHLVGRSIGRSIGWSVGQVATMIPFFLLSNSDANGCYAIRVADYESIFLPQNKNFDRGDRLAVTKNYTKVVIFFMKCDDFYIIF